MTSKISCREIPSEYSSKSNGDLSMDSGRSYIGFHSSDTTLSLQEIETDPNREIINKKGSSCNCYIKNNGRETVFVKELKPDLKDRKEYFDSIETEFKIGHKLVHDNIRKYYRYGVSEKGLPYIEMEYLPGFKNLTAFLSGKKPLSLDVERVIILQILSAVEFMHSPGQDIDEVTHGDLKPDNIMIYPYAGYPLRIIDFGLAHIRGKVVVASKTPGYTAPEQMDDKNPIKDILTDIYSIGKILLDINPDRYGEIANKASSENRRDRYQSIGELRKEYLELYEGLKSKTEWDTRHWKELFLTALKVDNLHSQKELLKQVYAHSISVVRNGGYDYGEGTVKINDSKAVRKSIPYSKKFETEPNESGPDMTIDLVYDDTLKVAGMMLGEDLHPAVLCACNRQTPKSAGGQEGDMLRRTDLWCFTYPYENSGVYPLDKNWGGIYSKGVTVFRGVDDDGYPLLETPFTVDVISVPAINKPTLFRRRLTDSGVKGTANKIRTIFRMAKVNGNDSLVLSAFGCGSYENPPEDIAAIFNKVLAEKEFRHSFKKVVFAIKEDRKSYTNSGSEGGNYEIFKRVLMQIE